MKKFTFDITQQASGYFKGKIDVEASSKKAAINKLLKIEAEELEGLVYDWEQGDEMIGDGDIEIYDDGKLIY